MQLWKELTCRIKNNKTPLLWVFAITFYGVFANDVISKIVEYFGWREYVVTVFVILDTVTVLNWLNKKLLGTDRHKR